MLLFLHVGVELLRRYQTKYAVHEKERQDLTNAEKLFDLPITIYKDLMDVDTSLKNMAKVYELYEAQRVSACLFNVKN